MNPLLIPYLFNIIILVPVGLLTLFGGSAGCRRVFQNKFNDSEGIRTILGAIWTAILLASVVGLFYPVSMSPLLLIQVVYKSLWLLVFVLPRLITEKTNEVPWALAVTFLAIVLSYPWVIPWNALLAVR